MPDTQRRLRLTAMDLEPILGVAEIARMPEAELPAFINLIHRHPDPGHVAMQMCQILLAMGRDEFALEMQSRALKHRRIYRVAGHSSPTVRLLALMGPGTMSGNTPLDFVVDRIPVQLDWLFVLAGEELPAEIPDHDVLIVAIGESGRDTPALRHVERLIAGWPRPVLNRPERIARCARDVVFDLLEKHPGLLVARTLRATRGEMHAIDFPATIRPVGTQAGRGLEKVETEAELARYLERYTEPVFYVADFVDYRSQDGLYRKLRIALIDGRPYICHVAISEHWMVHYKTAGMLDSHEKRLEEAATMRAFDRDFAFRHAVALGAIAAALGLDYVVLDCAQARDGKLLLFEADNRAWIHDSDPVALFPYKRAIMQKAFDAFGAMLHERTARGTLRL
jgi:glutathione synthase/RimK-type ligase-like ATP-grasp enzyme